MELLAEAFRASLLLCGSVKRAEEAVLESVASWDGSEPLGNALVAGAVEIAAAASDDPSPGELNEAAALLPVDLRRLLALPPPLRRGFVQRFLLGRPAVDSDALASLEALAQLVQKEQMI